MASVVALVADLLFGSRLQADLVREGHSIELAARAEQARAAVSAGKPAVLLVDLVDADLGGVELVAAMVGAGELQDTRTLGFFAHVEPAVRERALAAGYDLVVPRSRIAREGPALVGRLAARS